MIQARKSKVLDLLFRFYFRGQARQAFHLIAVRGLEHIQNLPADAPVLIFSNHTNWWDGLLAYLLQPYLKEKNSFLMMEEKQLRHYQFFTRLGAFSIDLQQPRKAYSSLRYTLKLLGTDQNLVWIFPQGKICPPQAVIQVLPGTEFLARKVADLVLVPVVFRYEFFRENRPNALIEIGPPFAGSGTTSENIREKLAELFLKLDQAAAGQDLSGFTPLFPPSLSINKKWEWVQWACLGKLQEFRPEN